MLSLGRAESASARAAVPPPYPEGADDALLPKSRAHPLRGIILLCSATPQCGIAQTGSPPFNSALGGLEGGISSLAGGRRPEHPGVQET